MLNEKVKQSLGKILDHHCKYSGRIYSLSSFESIGGNGSQELLEFLNSKNVIETRKKEKSTCPTCGSLAEVKDHDKGILVCSRLHKNSKNPKEFIELEVNNERLTSLLAEEIRAEVKIKIPKKGAKEFTPFKIIGYDQVGEMTFGDFRVLVLAMYKEPKPRDICILNGLLSISLHDLFLVATTNLTDETRQFLAYTVNGPIQFLPIDDLVGNPKILNDIMEKIASNNIGGAIRLSSTLKKEMQSVEQVISPETFKSMIEYDSKLVNSSYDAATHGKSDEFEDIVAMLLGSILPITQLGHNITEIAGKKIEIPDGVMSLPSTSPLKIMIYDCKSVGTEKAQSEEKSISQSDEDAIVRYCELFTGPRVPAKLIGVCIVANEFNKTNIENKTAQIRQRIPADIRLIFFPLRNLIEVYTHFTKERSKLLTRFIPEHVEKLLGNNLTKDELKEVEADEDADICRILSAKNVNSAYITKSHVHIFLDEIKRAPALEESFLDFVIYKSKQRS